MLLADLGTMKDLFRLAIPTILIPFFASIAALGQHAVAQNADSLAAFNPFNQGSIYRCNVDTVLLDAGPGYVSYFWNTGDTTQTIQATVSGKYIVGVMNAFDSIFYDTVVVSIIRYSIEAISTQDDPVFQNFDSVSDKSLVISLQYPINKETILYNNKGSIWVANEDCVIDSLTISIISYSPESSTEPSFGIVTVYEVAGDPLSGANLPKATYYWAATAPGLVTLPVNLYLVKGKTYQFNFGKGPQTTQSFFGNMASLRVGVVEGFSSLNNQGKKSYKSLSNGVWMKLQGRRINYQHSGNTFYSCFSNPIMINVNKSNFNNLWSTAIDIPSLEVAPMHDTTIYLNISNEYHSCHDSAVIDVFNVPFNPFATDSIFACSTSSFPLHAKTEGYNYYNWNTGSKDSSIIANTDAWYKVLATGGQNCVAADSVHVTVLMPEKKSYRFIGNGLYSDAANWEVLGVTRPGKPPAIIGPHESIYIDPAGVCIMDVQQTISNCSGFVVRQRAKVIIRNHLKIE
jgi:hypothetical protein